MIVRICPKCLSTDVHRSRRTGLRDHLMALFLMRPYRCFHCEHRFPDLLMARRMEPASLRPHTGIEVERDVEIMPPS
ncbi:MAG TPA: hypothetical protein VFA60_14295 [Terriglobales bacterium]|nr:hypothetical protein [Terriglobales bacterium]